MRTRFGITVAFVLLALGTPTGRRGAWAQTVVTEKPGAGEKARKTKTFPAYTDSQRVGHDSLIKYKMSLSASDVVSPAGKRTGFVTLRLASVTDGKAATEGRRNLDRAALRVFQANLDKIIRIEKRYASPQTKRTVYEYVPPTRYIMPDRVELFLHLGTGADAKLDKDNQWSVFFRKPMGEKSADFGCRDWKQLLRFQRQLRACARWLNRKDF